MRKSRNSRKRRRNSVFRSLTISSKMKKSWKKSLNKFLTRNRVKLRESTKNCRSLRLSSSRVASRSPCLWLRCKGQRTSKYSLQSSTRRSSSRMGGQEQAIARIAILRQTLGKRSWIKKDRKSLAIIMERVHTWMNVSKNFKSQTRMLAMDQLQAELIHQRAIKASSQMPQEKVPTKPRSIEV